MANVVYMSKTGLIGGEATKLDSIDGSGLTIGDVAFVSVSNVQHIYKWAASMAAESSPDVIAADANGGDNRWLLQKFYGTIPSGTKMLFYANTAPVGWTIDSTLDDKLVFVTKGSAAGGQTGGGAHSTGSWTQTSHTHTGPSHTHTVATHTHTGPSHTHTTASHALTTAELATHSHANTASSSAANESAHTHTKGATGAAGWGSGTGTLFYVPTGWDTGENTGAGSAHTHTITTTMTNADAGSGTAHEHGDTGAGGTGNTGGSGELTSAAGGTGNTGSSATANTWRPAAYCMIICEKD